MCIINGMWVILHMVYKQFIPILTAEIGIILKNPNGSKHFAVESLIDALKR